MGKDEGWAEPGGQLPNGLLPGASPMMRALDTDRWMKAEERTAELIACIQPNQLSEVRRNAVADYVQRLIMKCFPCQVCTFGSVPLKTYLPDGDIDLTAFSHGQNLKETWANQVRDMLENEEKNEDAEFHVKEVQYIQAEVKIIKCLVENIVVDISFNQVGGLCTLCFLDEVDIMINQNHLFKRSVILIKAWCYYESRILGAHHGLISTYALETLVLYIFHLFNNSFHGPLEVLYRFLEFFSNFDWDNFCVSLWGPVPISSLPDVTAEPPWKDSGELLLSKLFLDACSTTYAVFPGSQENNGQPFVSKHFNVIDPLRVNNNLGRSVNKGNFFRIRSAFAFGAKRLARLLDCPKENLIFEVNQFFMNTWERHGSGHRPDAPAVDSWHLRLSTSDRPHEYENSNTNNIGKNEKENSRTYEIKSESILARGVSYQDSPNSSRMMPITNELPAPSRTHGLKSQYYLNSLRTADQIGRDAVADQVVLNNRIPRDLKAEHLANDMQGRFLFARTRSSPELTDNYSNASTQVQQNRQAETADALDSYSRLDSSRRKNLGSESLASHSSRSSVEDASLRHVPSQQSPDADSISNNSHRNLGLDAVSEEFSTSSGAHMMHQEEQDIVNMMSSASLQGFNGQVHVPFNLTQGHIPYSIPPSILASMGYTQRNLPGFVPTNMPLVDPSFSHLQFPHGLVSPQLSHYFPGIGLNPPEKSVEQSSENVGPVEMNSREADNDFWQEQDASSSGGHDPENGNHDTLQSDDKPPAPSYSGLKYIPPPYRVNGSGSATRVQQKQMREKRGALRENNDTRSSEVYAEEKSASSRFSSSAHSNSLRSRTSSEGSWDGSSVKTPKYKKEKRGRKVLSTDPNGSQGKGKIISENVSNDMDNHGQEWSSSLHVGTEMVERNPGSEPVGQHMPGLEAAQTSGSDSTMPFAPILIGPGSRQRPNDNSAIVAFFPTGPPIPFLTMLPFYNMPPESGASEASGDETLGGESGMNFNPNGFEKSEDLNSSGFLRETSTIETCEDQKSDILNSDIDSHRQNLQFGRFCQNPQQQGPLAYPSPIMVPPGYVQGRLPYDNPGRPLSTNGNLFSQLVTNYGQRLVPVASPLQSVSSRHPNMYQSYIDDMPRYRSGTGTYLPNPKVSVRERHSSGNRRGNYNYDRSDSFSDRDGNWNANPKPRGAARGHARGQSDKSNSRSDRFTHSEGRADHSWNSYSHNSIPSYQLQNGQLRSNFNQNGLQNVAYTMYPMAPMNQNGVSNGPVPPVMMLYPFDHNATYSEQLEFGSLGPAGIQGINEQSQLNDRRIHGSSGHRSSPDQPSSPHHQRRV
ncbi:hypothetical protein ABFS82_02G173400 [Erythranthe guttata]|uniref:Polymerase nucleotidyl transferase domain-containing protein n=1 Tax=Erythranthe guttata TaxID=4155 RepID=A0A022QXZ1_ERYGU|nr:PREDICTED: uncharacterized protein LOC105963895 isoform X2 [Erythranthe guttata]EYU32228.1 hypothetical protein MIMGU_mgv1a000273mg [Erythranthe guttata]|eukprot:XP_012843834.1 PREDICTED: uncharacterized protein LOC105963895 isoform X2 [Erythranthe guttata]